MGIALLALVLTTSEAFDYCEVEGPSAGVERRISCGDDVWVSVSVDKPKDAGKAAMLDIIEKVTTSSADAGEEQLRQVTAGPYVLPGRSYKTKLGTGYVVLLDAGADRVRMAQCEERAPKRCAFVFLALAKGEGRLPEPTKWSRDDRLRFGAKTLTVPPNCRSPAPARIECSGTALTWGHFGADEEGVFDVSVQALEAGLGRLGTVARQKVDCTVAGSATTCALLTITKPDGKELFTVFGVGKSGNEQIAAQCNATKGPSPTLGAPCEQAISLTAN